MDSGKLKYLYQIPKHEITNGNKKPLRKYFIKFYDEKAC